MTFRTSILEKMGMFPNETIHIPPRCTVHLHGHQNKVVPFMKPSILVDLSNGTKIRNYTCWLINDTQNHCLLRQVSNHHINNEDLFLLSYVKIDS
jgi:hypothetical protein